MSDTDKIEFSPQTLELVNSIIARYPEGREMSALIPLLHIAQAEFGGWLSVPVMDHIASLLKILPIEVYEVVTFYTMFNTKPVGKYVIEVCRTGPCWIMGAEDIISHLEKKFNIKVGETTPDGMVTIKEVECLADCGNAPVIQIGLNLYGNLTPQGAEEMVDGLIKKNIAVVENPYIIK